MELVRYRNQQLESDLGSDGEFTLVAYTIVVASEGSILKGKGSVVHSVELRTESE